MKKQQIARTNPFDILSKLPITLIENTDIHMMISFEIDDQDLFYSLMSIAREYVYEREFNEDVLFSCIDSTFQFSIENELPAYQHHVRNTVTNELIIFSFIGTYSHFIGAEILIGAGDRNDFYICPENITALYRVHARRAA